MLFINFILYNCFWIFTITPSEMLHCYGSVSTIQEFTFNRSVGLQRTCHIHFAKYSLSFKNILFLKKISIICTDHHCLLPGVWGMNSVLFNFCIACNGKTMHRNITLFSPLPLLYTRGWSTYSATDGFQILPFFPISIISYVTKNKKGRSLFWLACLKIHIPVSAGSCDSWS